MDPLKLNKLDQRLCRLIMLYGTLEDAILYEEAREYIQELIDISKLVHLCSKEDKEDFSNPKDSHKNAS